MYWLGTGLFQSRTVAHLDLKGLKKMELQNWSEDLTADLNLTTGVGEDAPVGV